MGTINLDYLPGNGVFSVTNGGGQGVREFLAAHSKLFGKMLDESGRSQSYWLEAGRVGKFKLYARSKGFTVAVK